MPCLLHEYSTLKKDAVLPVAILAGGLATRLRSNTETIPKSLLPILGEPFIAHQLRLLRARGRLAAIYAIVCGHPQVALDFFVELGLLPRFSPRWESHVLLLFVTQSYERIDAHGASCRDIARCHRHYREQYGNCCEMQRVGSAHTIKQAA